VTTTQTRTIVAILALGAAAACSSAQQSYTSGGDVDVSMVEPAKLSSGEITILQQMSDANILGHLMTIDSLEITMSDTALYHVKGDQASSYAKMMHLAHEDDRKTLRDIAASTGLVPTIDVGKLRSSHVAAGLDSVRKGSDLQKDQQYIRAQLELHRHALAELQVLEGVAKNPMLRRHIVEMLPMVRDHLARAEGIAKNIGAR
jgi:predicted outer membrane protein